MKVFAAVVDTGSFASAADRLDMSRAMTSKYVAHLEEHLGTRLLQRTTRKLTLTESGATYYERCVQILADIAEAEEGAVHHTEAPRGTLRVTMPVSFGILHMGPAVTAYMKRYPEVKIDILLNDRRVDLIEEGLDLAVRIGSLPESGLIARKLASDRIVICGAPEYFAQHGTPKTPEDLVGHNCLIYSYAASGDEWKLTGPDGEHAVRVSGSMRATNGDMVKLAALGGLGVMRQPLFLLAEELRSGRLVEVLREYRLPEIGIYAVYPSRKHLSAKVRSFVDFLAAEFAQKKEW
ncbi:LysR family transcriptional regulator [Noviherbaspirillum sp. UKPF54]|uniref:LysR family transcriptional regulator n=1 Tax=Noviherbaspirillum sp. UKPF54 TaxID=2601898 RepID=UPI0011B1057E|nr:LysR family transcriptional regulator [Noviherbaspirillum sp. UKPF54]QDZ28072.1 LysR family transcriptional regulator [Noviherbaspirillum sp. UKPF54]